MNPETNRFEPVKEVDGELHRILKVEVVPDSWPVFQEGQELIIDDYRWKVESCKESTLNLEAVGPCLSKGQQLRNKTKRRRKKRRK